MPHDSEDAVITARHKPWNEILLMLSGVYEVLHKTEKILFQFNLQTTVK